MPTIRTFFRLVVVETKKNLRHFFRHVFSFYGGLFLLFMLVTLLVWIFIYLPTIGETRRINAIAAEFKAHGCRSIQSYSEPMFGKNRLLKHLKLEKKVLEWLVFGPGAVVPQTFLDHPPYLPDLEMVGFNHSDPGDREFRWAVSNPSLQSLHIIGEHRITARGMLALKDRTGPLTLALERVPSVGHDLRHLTVSDAPAPDALILGDCQLDESCFESLSQLKLLRVLVLDGCTGYSSEDIDRLKTLPNIERIHGLPVEKQAEMDEHIRRRIEATP